MTNNEGGTDDEEFRNAAVVDRVNTTMTVWMGTSMACAQCHSHKYDPISQARLFPLLRHPEQHRGPDKKDEVPTLELFTEDQQRRRAAWEAEIARLGRILTTPTPELRKAEAAWRESFPVELPWRGLEAESAGESTLRVPLQGGALTALRLVGTEMGAVVSKVSATLVSEGSAPPSGRFVRLELPGRGGSSRWRRSRSFPGERTSRGTGRHPEQHRLRRRAGAGDRRQHRRRFREAIHDAHGRDGEALVGG